MNNRIVSISIIKSNVWKRDERRRDEGGNVLFGKSGTRRRDGKATDRQADLCVKGLTRYKK